MSSRRWTRCVVVSLSAAMLGGGPGASAWGRYDGLRSQDPSPAPVTCEQVLTSEEATAIVGDGYAGPAIMAPRPGFTGCDWQGDDTNFSVTFASTRALADEERTADGPSTWTCRPSRTTRASARCSRASA